VPRLLRDRLIKVDVALIRVRPTGVPGQYTVGAVADYTAALIETARCVVAEVDERLLLTGQDALVSGDKIDVLVNADSDEILLADDDPSELESTLARNVAAVIPDRATVQSGIGGLSVAVGRALFGHRDLGVHSGVLSDVFVDLVEKGIVTNADNGLGAIPSSVSRFLKPSSLPIRASAVSSLPAIASGRPRGATRLIIARTRKPS
jgi:acyl-CoA hydrolase